MYLLRAATASQEIVVGPFIDDTDFVTVETALSIANTDVKLVKAGATSTVNKNSGGGTHIASGNYSLTFDATDTDTVGTGRGFIAMSGALQVWFDFTVLPAKVYDSLIAGTDNIEADVIQWLGAACATPTVNGVPEVDVTHVGGTAQTAGDLAALINTLDDYVDTEVSAIKAKTDNLPADPADASDIAASFTSLNTKVDTIDGIVDAILVDTAEIGVAGAGLTALATQASVNTIDDFLDTEVAAIKAKTDNLPASPAAVGSAMTLDLTQSVPTSNTAQTVGDALNAARAQGFGKWVQTGTSLVLYANDGTTVVRTFTLDSATTPTSRT